MRQLVREKIPFILCIQETKLAIIDDFVCKAIWGDDCGGYSFRPSLGTLGGLVTLWDKNEVEVWTSISFDNVLVVVGRFLKSNEFFVVFNVYAPCDASSHHILWDNISNRLFFFFLLEKMYVSVVISTQSGVGQRGKVLVRVCLLLGLRLSTSSSIIIC